MQQLLAVVDAISENNEEVSNHVNQLDSDGTSVLMAAAAAGHVPVVLELLKRGARVNDQNVDGHTALMFAYNGKSQEESLLRNYQQYVLAGEEKEENEGQDGVSRLIEEAVLGHEKLIALLLERGADPLAQVHAAACFAPMSSIFIVLINAHRTKRVVLLWISACLVGVCKKPVLAGSANEHSAHGCMSIIRSSTSL